MGYNALAMGLTFPKLPLRMARLLFVLRPAAMVSLDFMGRGDALRGALGTNLKPEGCPPKCLGIANCPQSYRCAYAQFFAPMSRGKSIPGPFLIRPPLTNNPDFGPSRALQFELRLFGLAIASADRFIRAFLHTRESGLADVPTHLESVDSVDWEGTECEELFAEGRLTGGKPIVLTFERFLECSCSPAAAIDFLTPTDLVYSEQSTKVPPFAAVVQRARGRISRLCANWEGCEWNLPFELEELASKVQLVDWSGTWPAYRRKSRQNGHQMALTGFQGTVKYDSIPAELWPLLNIGQEIHVGTHTSWGLGWYRVRPQPDS